MRKLLPAVSDRMIPGTSWFSTFCGCLNPSCPMSAAVTRLTAPGTLSSGIAPPAGDMFTGVLPGGGPTGANDGPCGCAGASTTWGVAAGCGAGGGVCCATGFVFGLAGSVGFCWMTSTSGSCFWASAAGAAPFAAGCAGVAAPLAGGGEAVVGAGGGAVVGAGASAAGGETGAGLAGCWARAPDGAMIAVVNRRPSKCFRGVIGVPLWRSSPCNSVKIRPSST